MNPPPLPQPSAQTCPHCGKAVEPNVRFCPYCGSTLGVPVSQGTGCFSMLCQIVLAGLSLVLGLAGACFVLVGSTSLTNPRGGEGFLGFFLVGLVILAVAGLCVWGIIKLNKR